MSITCNEIRLPQTLDLVFRQVGLNQLIQALLKTQPLYDTQVSVSHTTRQPRPGEVHGEHYFFVNHDEFKEMISRDAFLEHAEVFGNY